MEEGFGKTKVWSRAGAEPKARRGDMETWRGKRPKLEALCHVCNCNLCMILMSDSDE